MKTCLLPLLCAAALLCTAPAHAQLAAPGEAGVAMGHVHLVARDVEASRRFFTALGGTPVQNGMLQLIQFPGVFIMLRQGEPTAGTVGSVINHFGFNVKDIKSSVAAWRAAGLTVETTARADQAWLMTPDAARVEILEDAAIREPIRMHHIHWNVVAVPEMQAWYAKHFGAVPGKRGQNAAGDLPGVNLTFGKVDTVNPGTRGRALDHIGFEVRNLAQFVARLEAAGVKIEAPIRKAGNGTTSIAFLTDPWGTYIELTEGLAPAPQSARGTPDVAVPVYRVDPFWPKMPLRNKWLIQGVPVMVTDHNDHIWVVSRPRDINPDENGASFTPPRTDCCIAAPAILEFDPEGNLLNAWGGPGYHPGWPAPGVARPGPAAEHAIAVDKEGNVWLTGTGRGDGLQKFTKDGKFLWDFGHRGPRPVPGQQPPPLIENNQQTDLFPSGISQFTLDEDAREIYIAHGKRILVYDYDGVFKRGWGGKGMPLSQISNEPTPPYDWKAGPPPDQDQLSADLHCIHLSVDGLVYVCDRDLNRIHVFTKQGKFVTSFLVAGKTIARGPECGGPGHPTLGMCGSTYNLVFSHDADQKYVLVADGTNHRIWIHDRRTGAYVGEIGSPGRMAGQLHWIDAIAMDSLGNIYTGEVDDGKRVQKFVLMNGDGVRRPRPHD